MKILRVTLQLTLRDDAPRTDAEIKEDVETALADRLPAGYGAAAVVEIEDDRP